MLSEQSLRSATLLLVLLNPFMLSVYLLDLIQDMTWRVFMGVLLRGAAISSVVFIAFAVVGDSLFTTVLQVRFGSFLIFGGLLFLFVSIRSFFVGPKALRELRGEAEHVAGSIAMPFMIGPGTVSASVTAGSQLPVGYAALAVVVPVAISVVAVLILKLAYDAVHKRYEAMVTRYIDMTGRAMTLVTGTIAVEMILRGVEQLPFLSVT